ncbi:MAG: hypothetical protein ACI8XD_001140 [Thermoproteota archaeon]|jgi:uncharacterized protein (DUF58 family)
MPTRAGVNTAVFAVLFLMAGRVFGIVELYIVAAAMLALVACASLWVILNRRSLQVRRMVNPARLHAGSTSTVTLDLSNNRRLPTPVAQITDEVQGTVRADAHVPPIQRHGNTRASYRVPTETRGRIEIGPMKTLVTDPFGLASSVRTSAPDTMLLVLPHVDVITPPPQPGGTTAQQMDRSPNRIGNNGDEFSSLRAYAIGDDLRKVHWPSSARNSDLVVRNEHIPEHGHSMVLLDVRTRAADPATFERMVSAAASIVVACRKRGDRVRLVTTDGVDHAADTIAGCDAILDLLAIVEQTKTASVSLPFRIGRSGAETGAMVVADNAETLIASMRTGRAVSGGTYVVRFRLEEAKILAGSTRLTSSRMINIEQGDDFVAAWTQAIRRR